MQLLTSGFSDTGPTSYSDELLDSNGNVILSSLFGYSNSTTLLAAGAYTCDVSVAGGGSGGFCGPCDQIDFELTLDANFTTVVPEPRGTIAGALLVVFFAGHMATRRCPRCMS